MVFIVPPKVFLVSIDSEIGRGRNEVFLCLCVSPGQSDQEHSRMDNFGLRNIHGTTMKIEAIPASSRCLQDRDILRFFWSSSVVIKS